jgi:hypothetical protein
MNVKEFLESSATESKYTNLAESIKIDPKGFRQGLLAILLDGDALNKHKVMALVILTDCSKALEVENAPEVRDCLIKSFQDQFSTEKISCIAASLKKQGWHIDGPLVQQFALAFAFLGADQGREWSLVAAEAFRGTQYEAEIATALNRRNQM